VIRGAIVLGISFFLTSLALAEETMQVKNTTTYTNAPFVQGQKLITVFDRAAASGRRKLSAQIGTTGVLKMVSSSNNIETTPGGSFTVLATDGWAEGSMSWGLTSTTTGCMFAQRKISKTGSGGPTVTHAGIHRGCRSTSGAVTTYGSYNTLGSCVNPNAPYCSPGTDEIFYGETYTDSSGNILLATPLGRDDEAHDLT